MSNSTEILDWDSDFFSLKIASITVNSYDEDFISNKLDLYKSNGFDLVYIFVNCDNLITSNITSLYNCKLVDCKVIYRLDLFNQKIDKYPNNVQEFTGESSQLYELGIQAGEESRYKLDLNFNTKDFERLYKVWIEKSVNHEFADKIIVYKENGIIIGFLTLKIQNNEAKMILMATDRCHRGKGIAKAFMEYAKEYAISLNCKYLSLATQKHNYKACSLYEKKGMKIKSQTNIYHVWLKK